MGWTMLTALALAGAATMQPTDGKPEPDRTYDVSTEDAAMNAAIDRGRATLPDFYRLLARPQAGDGEFMVKFDIDPSEHAEYVWATDLDRSRTPMTGVLINQPVNTEDRLGDRVAIPEDLIVDWGYRRGGVMQGNFTNRVLLNHMPADEAAEFRRFLGW
jgi:uncharacterized protein YegJ (DUF2314 family)